MPNVMVNTKFFFIRQNNSGGYHIINDSVAPNLIVEATDAEDAVERIKAITAPFYQYCSCCGERWGVWLDDEDGTEQPTIYGEEIDEQCGETIIHYFDGRKEKKNYV